MKRTFFLVICLMTLSFASARTWQTWNAKGFEVQNYNDPAPVDANDVPWYKVSFDDSMWNDITGPVESFQEHGAYYVRREFTVAETGPGLEYVLFVHSDDNSEFYINDSLIAQSSCDEENRFVIPSELIHKGKNLIAAVVYDNGGEQFLRMNIEKHFEVRQGDFMYEMEDGFLSVSVVGNVEYAANARYAEQITAFGETYTVNAIKNLHGITNIFITKAIERIEGDGRWGALGEAESVTVDAGNRSFKTIDDNLYTYDGKDLFWGADQQDVTVPEGVESIHAYAFFGCRQLQTITLPSTLNAPLYRAFSVCTNLKSINIPQGVPSLDYWCFSDCSSLNSVYLNVSRPYDIDESIFANVSRTNCTIYVPVGSVELYQDYRIWSEFENIESDSTLLQTDISNIVSGYIYEFDEEGILRVNDLPLNYDDRRHAVVESITLKGKTYDVRNLGSFNYRTVFNIPSFITSFRAGRWGTFGNQMEIVTVDSASRYFSSTDTMVFNKDGSELLWALERKEIIVPEGVKSIAPYCFFDMENLEHISLPSTLEGALHRLFEDCTKLQELVIPEGVTSLDYLFCNNCRNLKSVKLPNSLERLGAESFQQCFSLESIIIPRGVGEIQESVFRDCPKLKTIVCPIPQPLFINPNVYEAVDKETAVLYVQHGCRSLYKEAPVWRDFKNIVESPFYTKGGLSNILPIYLDVNKDITDFQFDFILPEGISIAKDPSTDDYLIELGDERFQGLDHTLSTKLREDGSIRIVCSSASNSNINGNVNEPVLLVTLDIDDDIDPGYYMFWLKNIVFATYQDGQTVKDSLSLAFFEASVSNVSKLTVSSGNIGYGTVQASAEGYDSEKGTVLTGNAVTLTANANEDCVFVDWTDSLGNVLSGHSPYYFTITQDTSIIGNFALLGDVFADDEIDVADLCSTIGLVLEPQNCSHRDSVTADVYTDGIIDVADYSSIVDIILNGNSKVPHALRRAASFELPSIGVEEKQTVLSGSYVCAPVIMRNAGCNVIALQFDLTAACDIRDMIGLSLTDRSAAHDISTSFISDNVMRVVLTSTGNLDLTGTEGAILSLNVNKDLFVNDSFSIDISNIVLVTSEIIRCQQDNFKAVIDGTVTKVTDVIASDSDPIYDLKGVRQQTLNKGFNVSGGKVIFK